MGAYMADLFDITERKHGGNEESRLANEKTAANKRAARAAIFNLIYAAGADGMTCREAADKLGRGMNAISGRFSELKAEKMIFQQGRRDGCGVYVAGVNINRKAVAR
jgi:hypothetical protein